MCLDFVMILVHVVVFSHRCPNRQKLVYLRHRIQEGDINSQIFVYCRPGFLGRWIGCTCMWWYLQAPVLVQYIPVDSSSYSGTSTYSYCKHKYTFYVHIFLARHQDTPNNKYRPPALEATQLQTKMGHIFDIHVGDYCKH